MSHLLLDTRQSELQKLEHPLFFEKGVEVYVKRDDLIDEEVSGNKWRKLRLYIEDLYAKKQDGILTFGGAYSNHLLATAAACARLGLKSVGVVRGEELTPESNSTLKRCVELGMKLKFVSRQEYQLKADYDYLRDLRTEFPNLAVVHEGGAGFYGMLGCQEILNELPFEPNHLFVALGTGTTAAGLLLAGKSTQIHAISALKGFHIKEEIKKMLQQSLFDDEFIDDLFSRLVSHEDGHFGGYAKLTEELLTFIQRVYKELRLPLDHVYTAKAFFELWKFIEENKVKGEKVVFLHTGGLQGSTHYLPSSNK